MLETPIRVLFVHEEKKHRDEMKKRLTAVLGVEVKTTGSCETMLLKVRRTTPRFNIILIDSELRIEEGGISQIEGIRQSFPEILIILRNQTQKEVRKRAHQIGVFRCRAQWCEEDELFSMVRAAIILVHQRSISDRLQNIQDYEEMIQETIRAICQLTRADEAAITLVDTESHKLERYSKAHYDQKIERIFLQPNFTHALIKTGKTVIISDTFKDQQISPDVYRTGIRSLIGVPIHGEEENIGVLFAFSKMPDHFDDYEVINPMVDLASHVGTKLLSMRALKETRVQISLMKELIELGGQLTQPVDLKAQCWLAWKFVSNQLNVSSFFIGIYASETQLLQFPLAIDMNQEIQLDPRSLNGDRDSWGLSGHVVRTGEELFWLTQEESFAKCRELMIQPILVGRPCQSCLSLPLKIGEKVTGMISIQSYDRYAFNTLFVNVFRAFASLFATVLENRRLLEAEETRSREAESLRQAALAISLDRDVTQLTHRLLIELQKVVPYDSASVQLLKEGHFVIIDGHGFLNLTELKGVSFDVDSDNPNREVYTQRQPVVFNDVTKRFPHMSKPPHNQAEIHSWLGVPMFERERLIGMLALDKKTPAFYTKNHARLAEAFASQAALTLRNAELLENAKIANAYLQSAYQASLDIISPMATSDVLLAMVEKIRLQTNAWRVATILWEKDLPPKVLAQVGFGDNFEEAISIRSNGISREVMRSRSVRFFSNPDLGINQQMWEHGVRAAICLPLQVANVSFGVIWIHFRESHEFTDIEIKVLTTLANQSAIAYQHSHLYEDLRKVHNEARAATHSVVKQGFLEAMNSIAVAAKNALKCDIVTLYAYYPNTDTFGFPPALVGVGDREKVLALGKVSVNSLVREMIKMDDPYYCVDTRTDTLVNQAYERKEESQTFIERENIGSFCAVPLVVASKKVGILFINFHRVQSRQEFDEDNIQWFSNQAAIAIQMAQLYQEAKENEDVLKKVLEANKANNKPLPVLNVLKLIAEQACRLTGSTGKKAKVSHISLVKNGKLVFQAVYPQELGTGIDKTLIDVDLSSIAHKQAITVQAIEQRRPQLISELNARQQSFLMTGPMARSALAVPIIFSGKVTGVISVEHDETGNFDEQDVAILETLAGQAAFTIETAELYEKVREHRGYLKALDEANRTMISALPPDEILSSIAKTITKAVNAWRATTLVFEESEDQPRLIAQFGFDDPADAKIPVRPQGISKQVIRTLKPVFQEDIQADNVLVHPTTIQQGARATACLPLLSATRPSGVIGVLWIHFRKPHQFSDVEKDALQLYATQSSISYQRSVEFAELKKSKGLVGARTAVAWMGMVSTYWRHTIEKKADAINDSSTLIRLLLAKDYPDMIKVEEHLKSIQLLVAQIKEKPINAPLPDEEEGGAIPINSLVGERLQQLWTNPPFNQIQLESSIDYENNILVRANREWLRRAFDILIDNAVQALVNVEQPCIRIATHLLKDRVEVSVEDNGPGIPAWLQEYLLIKPVPKQIGERGLGLGLLMAQTIIQSYNGEIRADYAIQHGSRFIIELPIEISQPSCDTQRK